MSLPEHRRLCRYGQPPARRGIERERTENQKEGWGHDASDRLRYHSANPPHPRAPWLQQDRFICKGNLVNPNHAGAEPYEKNKCQTASLSVFVQPPGSSWRLAKLGENQVSAVPASLSVSHIYSIKSAAAAWARRAGRPVDDFAQVPVAQKEMIFFLICLMIQISRKTTELVFK